MAGASVVATGRWNSGNLRRGAEADLNYLQRQANGFGKSMMSSFAGIGAAMGGLFAATAIVGFMKDAAQAAMEDERSMLSLAKAMDNVGQGFANSGIEDFIGKMQLATGVADSDLRSAYQRLITVTANAAQSQRLLSVAMDVSAGTGKDLEAVSMALAKAAGGQTTALQRLGVGLDQATLKSKDMDAITAQLSAKFGGQAATAANSYEGQMKRLTASVDEAKEAIGYALLRAVDDLSNALGGTDGLQGAIAQAGDRVATWIDDVRNLSKGLSDVTTQSIKLMTLGLVPMTNDVDVVAIAFDVMQKSIMRVGGPIAIILDGLKRLGVFGNDAADATRAYTSATVQAGIAAGGAKGVIHDLTGEVEQSGLAAMQAADSFAGFWKAAANLSRQQQTFRDLMNTSGTVGSALLAEALRDAGKSADGTTRSVDRLKNSSGGAASSSRQAAAAVSDWAKNVDALGQSLQGLVDEVNAGTALSSVASFDNINKQIDAFKAKFSEAKSFAQGIVDSFMGQLDLGAAIDAAKAAGTSIVEEFSKQGEKAVDFGNKMQELLKRGLSKAALQDIMKLGFDRGMDVMNELSTGAVDANIANINKVYDSVELMANTVADQAKEIFYDAGLQLMITAIRAMIKELMPDSKSRRALMHALDDLAASMNRTFTITGSVVMPGGGGGSIGSAASAPVVSSLTMFPDLSGQAWIDAVQADPLWQMLNLPGGGMFADGGIATSPTPGIFGEAGPEALIPLDRMGDFGGNTYQITVQAGVGDPRAIGKSVVEAITLFERSSGPVFARA